ncbi:MAG: hypothetical protein V8Q42_10820 [Anaerovoracaceae bacterium]
MILPMTVGSAFQDPRSQFFNVDTTSEITFGCEKSWYAGRKPYLNGWMKTTEALDLRNLLGLAASSTFPAVRNSASPAPGLSYGA